MEEMHGLKDMKRNEFFVNVRRVALQPSEARLHLTS